MKRVLYKRIYHSDKVTMGHVYYQSKRIMSLLEPPWKYNYPNESCIPSGIYICILQEHVTQTGDSYPAYQVLNVTDRTNIEIHVGNTISDTKGCLIEGLIYDEVDEQVLQSREAHKMFIELIGDPEFILEIIDSDGIKRNLDAKIHYPAPRIKESTIEPIILPSVPDIDAEKANKVTVFQKTLVWLNGKKRLIGLCMMGIGWVLKKLPDATINLAGEGIEAAGSALAAVGLVHAEVKKVNGVDDDTFWEKAWRWIKKYVWPLIQELTKKME